MMRRICRKSELFVVCCVTFVMIVLALQAYAGTMTISPHRIVLNAKCEGKNQDIQAIIRARNDAIKKVVDWDVQLSLVDGDTEIELADAFLVRYCWDDGNFLISFDRSVVQNHSAIKERTNQTVTFRVSGWYKAESFDGNEIDGNLSGEAQAEIVAPGKNKQ